MRRDAYANTSLTLILGLSLPIAVACTDDGAASDTNSSVADESESDDESTSEDSTTESDESTTESEDSTTESEDSTTDDESSTDTTDTTDEGGEDGTTGEEPACDGSDPEVASWLLDIDGVFPDDLPADAEETCALLESDPGVLRASCPSFAFDIVVEGGPAPELPAPTDAAIVRVHHEPGWLNWPDLWIDVEVANVAHWGFQSTSALAPAQGEYAAPWSPTLTEDQCGPFIAEDMFGPDPCGEQVGHAIAFDVDGAPVVAWHATHVELDIDGRAFDAWVGAAREYLQPPQFCDTSPTWYSLITRRELD